MAAPMHYVQRLMSPPWRWFCKGIAADYANFKALSLWQQFAVAALNSYTKALDFVRLGGLKWESDRQRANMWRRAGAYKFIEGSS